MDKTFGLSAGKSEVRIPGRGKYLLRTTAVDARINSFFILCSVYQCIDFDNGT